jgi:hypothetical protein
MRRLVGNELAGIGRRVQTEIEVEGLTAAIREALIRLMDVEATAHIRGGPNALRINGYM